MILFFRLWLILHLIPCFLNGQELRKIAVLPKSLEETSALAYVPKIGLFTLNDDKQPYLYKICENSGEILQVINVSNCNFKDKEALAADEQYIYIGDIGDNKGKRKSLKIAKVPIQVLKNNNADTISLEAKTIEVEVEGKIRPDKKKHNLYDFEAMIVENDTIYLFSKRRKDLKTSCYSFSNASGKAHAKHIFDLETNGLITGASLRPNSNEIWLSGYQKQKKQAFLIQLSDWKNPKQHQTNMKKLILKIDDTSFQLEGITFLNKNTLILSNEWTNDYTQAIYQIVLSEAK